MAVPDRRASPQHLHPPTASGQQPARRHLCCMFRDRKLRRRRGTEICNFGALSPLDLIFCPADCFPFSPGFLCNFVRKSPQNWRKYWWRKKRSRLCLIIFSLPPPPPPKKKGSFGKRGLLKNVRFREILENLEILEISQSVGNEGESDHFLEKLEILESLEIPPAKRPFP